MKWLCKLILSIMILLIVSACSASNAPANAAKEWFIATNTNDALKADDLVCNANKEDFRSQMKLFIVITLISNQDIELDVSKLEFKTVKLIGENAAHVNVQGDFRALVGGVIQGETIDRTWLMVKENDTWVWCGEIDDGSPQDSNPGTPIIPVEADKPLSINDITGRFYKIKTLMYTFNAIQGAGSNYSGSGEMIINSKIHTITKWENNKTEEIIGSQNTICSRLIGEQDWECYGTTDYLGDQYRNWVDILQGKPSPINYTTIDMGMKLSSIDNKPCYLYYVTAQRDDGDIGYSELCLDKDTWFPIYKLLKLRVA